MEYKFYMSNTQYSTGDSIFLELSNAYDGNKFDFKKSITLDTHIIKNNLPLPEFIKIDVQGAELLILKGAENSLLYCEMILLEVSLHRYNKDSPLFIDIINYMDKIGYCAIDILEEHYINNYCGQIDILFSKKNSKYFKNHFYN